MLRLPNPPTDYDLGWANQYTRILELENQTLGTQLQQLQAEIDTLEASVQQLQLFILPNYTTVEKDALTAVTGQMVFDTDLDKACVYCSGGWETITSAP